MSKMQNLQSALERSTGRTTKPEPVATPPVIAPVGEGVKTGSGRPPSRQGQFNLSSWQPLAFKSSLRLVQARKGNATIQDLMAEALNDLFIKYDVPTVNVE
jgi:hypothetical protein